LTGRPLTRGTQDVIRGGGKTASGGEEKWGHKKTKSRKRRWKGPGTGGEKMFSSAKYKRGTV